MAWGRSASSLHSSSFALFLLSRSSALWPCARRRFSITSAPIATALVTAFATVSRSSSSPLFSRQLPYYCASVGDSNEKILQRNEINWKRFEQKVDSNERTWTKRFEEKFDSNEGIGSKRFEKEVDEMTVTITDVVSRSIYDSRGNPTVEADVHLSNGSFHRAAVPSGASTGIYEALELRDGGKDFLGKGVTKAVSNIQNIIKPALVGKNPVEQTAIDNLMVQELDGTQNEWGWCKQKLGANAILAVSLAVARAGAAVLKLPLYQHIANLAGNKELILPVPALNVINGGSHAGNKLAMQEFMILPTGASSFKEAMKMGSEVYHNLKSVIKKKYGQDATNVGDEGGFAPNIQENKEGLELLKVAIEKAGYTGKVVIGMDVAASEFYNSEEKKYDLNFKEDNNDGSQKVTGDQLIKLYESFVADFPILTIEDPFDQDDWEHYAKITSIMGEKVQIVGDDLLVTNPKRVNYAIKDKACNALLLKVNQIGSLTESIEAVKLSKRAGWGVMTSHRSGETEDTFIADLAVGLSTGQIKTGAPCRSERLAKYNQLLRIEEELGDKAVYAGLKFRKPVEPY